MAQAFAGKSPHQSDTILYVSPQVFCLKFNLKCCRSFTIQILQAKASQNYANRQDRRTPPSLEQNSSANLLHPAGTPVEITHFSVLAKQCSGVLSTGPPCTLRRNSCYKRGGCLSSQSDPPWMGGGGYAKRFSWCLQRIQPCSFCLLPALGSGG